MGVQPPPSGDTDDVGAVEFGIAELDARLGDADLTFPATASEVTDALGETAVSCGPGGDTLTVAEALDRTDAERFDTRTELLDALHPVFERERRSRSGVVEMVRSIIPL